ncbi:MAG: laccase domain-containing protein [Gammaproteobacteria bacterium]|nr:laccase domain-containing protein [Gammaproteobacteria bacterium]
MKMPVTVLSFFGSRQQGLSRSDPKKEWCFGKGNVFLPPATRTDDASEQVNALENTTAIIAEQFKTCAHAGVMLESQYGKGICVVDDALLTNPDLTRDQGGRVVIQGDGLFTTLKNIPLLNRSGDAHAVIFEAEGAIGILVGAWRCMSQEIIQYLLEHFLKAGISPQEITVKLGPGLGAGSYSIGNQPLSALAAAFGEAFDEKTVVSYKKDKKGQPKAILNMPALLQKYSRFIGFQVDVSQSVDTFSKTEWRRVKAEAIETQDPLLPIRHYENQSFFSARLYVRADRLARRIAQQSGKPLPEELVSLPSTVDIEDKASSAKLGRHAETGRCLNGVMMR